MATINPQADALNATIKRDNPHVLELLSARGRAIFFPTKGILGQTAEAKGKRINATIGTALEDDGTPVCLPSLAELVKLDPKDAFLYAPSYGRPDLRQAWQQQLLKKNPSLAGKPISLPVVTHALTHGLSLCGYLFLDPGDEVILPDQYWGNYRLLFENAYGAKLVPFNTFRNGGFDVEALKAALNRGAPGKRVVLLNFPNNPTGYTATTGEAAALTAVLTEAAQAGNRLVVILDDAYFGLVYEPGVFAESLAATLADKHERLLTVKADAATKEDYVWGFRVGFLTYAVKGGTPALYKALEDKTAGAVRGNISNASNLAQALLLKTYTHPDYAAQKREKFATLKRRYDKVKAILAAHPEYRDAYEPLPFNSGYFMCVVPKGADAEQVRLLLLKEFDTGVIATGGVLRLAFSATPLALLDDLFANVYQAVRKARG